MPLPRRSMTCSSTGQVQAGRQRRSGFQVSVGQLFYQQQLLQFIAVGESWSSYVFLPRRQEAGGMRTQQSASCCDKVVLVREEPLIAELRHINGVPERLGAQALCRFCGYRWPSCPEPHAQSQAVRRYRALDFKLDRAGSVWWVLFLCPSFEGEHGIQSAESKGV